MSDLLSDQMFFYFFRLKTKKRIQTNTLSDNFTVRVYRIRPFRTGDLWYLFVQGRMYFFLIFNLLITSIFHAIFQIFNCAFAPIQIQ